jgi:L-ribulose-5-phosphate 3-epimerase UlaE
MIPQNVVNIQKKGNIIGHTFHLFYPDINTCILFDRDFTTPIIWGSKNIVMTWVKKLNELMETKPETKVRIYSYIIDTSGYRRIDIYNGPIETIGKYIRRI